VTGAPLPTGFAEKRRLFHARGIDAERLAVARAFLAAGRRSEALEVLERHRDPATLEEVRRSAVAAGDAFALSRCCQILKADPSPAEWRDLAAAAGRAERWYDAVNALGRAGDAEAAEALRAERCPDFRPFRPLDK
jgi:hypothetical protein